MQRLSLQANTATFEGRASISIVGYLHSDSSKRRKPSPTLRYKSYIANAMSQAKIKVHQDGDHSTPKSTLHQETEKVSSQVQKWMLRMQAAKSQGA
jgi:hypothetical protein